MKIVLINIILKVDFICSGVSIILNNRSSYMHIIFHYYAISILGNSISRAHTYIIMILCVPVTTHGYLSSDRENTRVLLEKDIANLYMTQL